MAQIVFYCRVERRLLETAEFYRQDIDALEALGHDVIVATRLREIPASFDCMFVWWWTHAAIPVFLSRLSGRPSIITGTFNFRLPTEFEGIDYFRRPFWQRWLIRYAVRKADLNIFVNELERDSCSQHFRIDSARYCAHAVGDEYLRNGATNRELAIFNLCWSQKSNLRRKGIPELIQAVALLRTRGIDMPLYLAGHEGDGLSWLKGLIDQNDVTDQVTLLGELSRGEKIEMLTRCEFYVQPSWYEGFGLAQAEAMASGACVITCRTGAVGEVVGDAGVYVEPGNPSELADAIARLIAQPELRISLQQRAQERIRERFSPSRKRTTFAGILDEILQPY